MTAPGLHVEVAFEERHVDLALEVHGGETVALIGPNGAGKSTVLGALAGLLRPSWGRAQLGERVLFALARPGHADGSRSWSPAFERRVSLLEQQASLFPHLTARQNVAFGPSASGAGRREALARADQWLDELDAAPLAARKPDQLSGGQAQRVAIARALATEPELLLLDEPMSALDVTASAALRPVLRRVLADRTALIVTHDVLDAYVLADRVGVIEGGRLVEFGATADVFDRPRSAFAAALVGLNLVHGEWRQGRMRVTDLPGHADLLLFGMPDEPLAEGTQVGATIRPARIALTRPARPADGLLDPSADGRLGANADTSHSDLDTSHSDLDTAVTELAQRGDLVRITVGGLAADLAPADVGALGLEPGMPIRASIPADAVRIFAI